MTTRYSDMVTRNINMITHHADTVPKQKLITQFLLSFLA